MVQEQPLASFDPESSQSEETAMRVRDLMSRPVFTLELGKHVIIASKIMNWARVRHVPVVDEENHVVGLVTQRDLLKFSIASFGPEPPEWEDSQDGWTIPIERVMRREIQTIGPEEPIQEAARLMRKHKYGCLPVVNGGVLVGIISEHDLLGVVERLESPRSVASS